MSSLAGNSTASMESNSSDSGSNSLASLLENSIDSPLPNNASSNAATTAITPATSSRPHALVTWLENSQFDYNNELLGRMSSVPHANIIDPEPENLRPGTVISVFRNSGEIWRAQVVKPKTSALDGHHLASSPTFNQRSNKFQQQQPQIKSSGSSPPPPPLPSTTTGKQLTDLVESMSPSTTAANNNSAHQQNSMLMLLQSPHHETSTSNLMSSSSQHLAAAAAAVAASSSSANNNSSMQQLTSMSAQLANLTSSQQQHQHNGFFSSSSNNNNNNNNNNFNMMSNNGSNNSRVNKELLFLQSAINEADLSDLYQTLTSNTGPLSSQQHHHQHQSEQLNISSASSSNNSINANYHNSNGHHLHHHSHQSSYQQSSGSGSRGGNGGGKLPPGGGSGAFSQYQSNGYPDSMTSQHQLMIPSQQHQSSNDMNVIMQMQGELVDQHKELRLIENQTMEQLRVLQSNLNRLAKRFDSFECTVLNHVSRVKNNAAAAATQGNGDSRNAVSKLNNKMQQIKIIENELQKDFLTSTMIGSSSNMSSQQNQHVSLNRSPPPQSSQFHSSQMTMNMLNGSNNSNSNSGTALSTPSNIGIKNESVEVCQAANNSSTASFSASRSKRPKNKNRSGDVMLNSSGVAERNINSSFVNETGVVDDLMDHKETSEMMNVKIQGLQSQIALNRFVRDKVKEKVGTEFLATHQISEIPSATMEDIKKDAFSRFLPDDRRPLKAWGLAMCSLRCLKRELVKNRNKQTAAVAAAAAAAGNSANTAPTEVIDFNNNHNSISNLNELNDSQRLEFAFHQQSKQQQQQMRAHMDS